MADILMMLITTNANRTPAAATNTIVYEVPAGRSAMLTRILIANNSPTSTAFRIALVPAIAGVAQAISADDYVAYDVPIEGNDTINFAIGAGLAAADRIYVYNTLATLIFTPLGIEVT
jgi:hypothetical protein